MTNGDSLREKVVTDSDEKEEDAKLCLWGLKGQKVLGVAWDFDDDTISLDLAAIANHAEDPPTIISKIFDPLEIIEPLTIIA